jgi:hypothetical protein
LIIETGTYALVGNQLTLTPRKATRTLFVGGIARFSTRLPLEQTTYTWGKRYLPETNEWHLVLTPPKPTVRDGRIPPNTPGHRYSDRVQPAWTFGSQPGV